jgi:hypothetical protein
MQLCEIGKVLFIKFNSTSKYSTDYMALKDQYIKHGNKCYCCNPQPVRGARPLVGQPHYIGAVAAKKLLEC